MALLNDDINKAPNAPEVKTRLTSFMLDITPGSPDDFCKFLETEDAHGYAVVKEANECLDESQNYFKYLFLLMFLLFRSCIHNRRCGVVCSRN